MARLDFVFELPGRDDDCNRSYRLLEAIAVAVVLLLASNYSRGQMTAAARVDSRADFGARTVATLGPRQQITVRSVGRSALHVARVSITGTTTAAFFVEEDECSHARLPPGSSCVLTVGFAPPAAGDYRAALLVEDDADGSPQSVALLGSGVEAPRLAPEPEPEPRPIPGIPPSPEPPPIPEPQARPVLDPVDLALSADVGATAGGEVRVSNRGDAPLELLEISFQGDRGAFSLDQSACARGPIPPGGACTLGIAFAPRRAESQSTIVAIYHAAPGNPLLLALHGQGIGPPEGYCCLGGRMLKLDALSCSERNGEFATDPRALAKRCRPPDLTPPLTPGPLRPGNPDDEKPVAVNCASGVMLSWRPVDDVSAPVDYLVTLDNGRGVAGSRRPTSWATIRDREPTRESSQDVARWVNEILAPQPRLRELELVRPPMAGKVDPRLQARRERAPRVSFPVFRWQVTARDAAGNESPPSPWHYFRCQVPVG